MVPKTYEGITFSKHKSIASTNAAISYQGVTCYGNKEFHSIIPRIFTWSFKLYGSRCNDIWIGIAADTTTKDFKIQKYSYCVNGGGYHYKSGTYYSNAQRQDDGIRWKDGDSVDVKLDLTDKTLEFYNYDQWRNHWQSYTIKQIPIDDAITYRFACTFNEADQSIELQSA